MFYTTDAKDRAEFISSLENLLVFLAANPAIPVPKFGAEITLHADSYEDGGKEQVERIARQLNASVYDDTPENHCKTTRVFGCIGYSVVAISHIYDARRDAQCSYESSVILDAS